MIEGRTIIGIIPAFDEVGKIEKVVDRVPRQVVDEVLVVDDGSTDETASIARAHGATVIELGATLGVGAALRRGYEYAVEKGYDIAVVMAGNNKDAPEEIPELVAPIIRGEADMVQGSRYLRRSGRGDMPLYRRLATRLHPLLFSLAAGRRVTESTNGFRALTRQVLADPRIDLRHPRLDGYELEPYLYLRVIKVGYRTAEVPVTKVYPPRAAGQTKMKPFTDWWAILRPIWWALRDGRGRRREGAEP